MKWSEGWGIRRRPLFWAFFGGGGSELAVEDAGKRDGWICAFTQACSQSPRLRARAFDGHGSNKKSYRQFQTKKYQSSDQNVGFSKIFCAHVTHLAKQTAKETMWITVNDAEGIGMHQCCEMRTVGGKRSVEFSKIQKKEKRKRTLLLDSHDVSIHSGLYGWHKQTAWQTEIIQRMWKTA